MGFDDLNDALEEQDEQNSQESEVEPETERAEGDVQDRQTRDQSATQKETMPDTTSEPQSQSQSSKARSEQIEAVDQPAFSFDETKQDALYALPDDWDAFDDMLALELEQALRSRDIRDVPKREKHSAALHVISEYANEIADEIERRRRRDTESVGR